MPDKASHEDIFAAIGELTEKLSLHEKDVIHRHNDYMKHQLSNTDAIKKLTNKLDVQIADTKVVVDTLTAGRLLGRLGKWVGSIAFLGWVGVWINEHFKL